MYLGDAVIWYMLLYHLNPDCLIDKFHDFVIMPNNTGVLQKTKQTREGNF